jgi:transcriptional regulator with PAS, ATPase and Fis domain
VLLTGESGTGKGVLAAAIHAASGRARYPIIAVNCAGVPAALFESEFFGHARGAFTGAVQARRGLLEQANRGTLFLDEIGELDVHLQAKLLTALETGEFRRVGAETVLRSDARIIAATGVELQDAIARGDFRLDLYHRLLVLAFHLPPLRERDGDCLELAAHFLHNAALKHRRDARAFDDRALERIARCTWPGNIRQLAHAIEAAVLVCDGHTVRAAHLPARIMHHAHAGEPPNRYSFFGSRAEERQRIESALRAYRGNKTRTARALGMARNTLRARLLELGLDS